MKHSLEEKETRAILCWNSKTNDGVMSQTDHACSDCNNT